MHPILRNIIAVIVGWFGGSLVNMGLIKLGHTLMPVDGLDPNDMDSLIEIMPTLSYEYYIFPFLAHALGTLIGATVAGLIAANRKMTFALVIGVLNLIGGIMINYMITGPMWFSATDIIVAYIPMALLGGKIAMHFSAK